MIQTKERVTNIPQNRKKRSFVGYHQMVHPFFFRGAPMVHPKKSEKKTLVGCTNGAPHGAPKKKIVVRDWHAHAKPHG